jgi:3D (Asp-Asp-Asp) domain-containing protein
MDDADRELLARIAYQSSSFGGMMRRPKKLTTSDQWELGLFMGLLVMGFLCLAAVWQSGGLDRVLAFASDQREVSAPLTVEPSFVKVSEPAAPAAPVSLTRAEDSAPRPVENRPALKESRPSEAETIAAPPKPAKLTKLSKEPEYRWYNGEKYKYVKTMKMRVTGYAPDVRCTWPYPGTTTASGLSVKTNKGRLVAADTRVIPMHSLVAIPGYHGTTPVPVLDRGGARKGNRLDLLFPTFEQAQKWGVKYLDIKIYAPVDDDEDE